ncbi:MAG: M56 family metallopeptidase [Actinomycetota bacterium]|nr:M56 family metallopeptidase [Actinomycetota bacterium]
MTLAVALLIGTLLVLWLAPATLVMGLRHRVEPRAVLTAWLVLVASTFLTLVAAVTVSLLPGHGPARRIVALLQHCWSALRHGDVPSLDAVAGLAGVVLLTFSTVRVVLAGCRRVQAQCCLHRRHVDLLRGIAQVEPGRYPLLWLEHPEPLAYSVAGAGSSRCLIVATRGLVDRLDRRDVTAVLDHERAHLQGHHHLLVGLADALAAALPRLPMMRLSPDLVRTFVELAADRVSARANGTAAVRGALLALSTAGGPSGSLAMGRDAVSVRLRWLEHSRPSGRVRTAAAAAVAGLTAGLAPTLLGVALIAAAGLATCATTALG